MTEIEYSQYIFQDKNIDIPLELSFLKEILNEKLFDYYEMHSARAEFNPIY